MLRATPWLVAAILLSGLLPTASAHEVEGPLFATSVKWAGGDLLTWSVSTDPGATYRVKMGPSPSELTTIATTATPIYNVVREELWPVTYYGISTIVDGVESETKVFASSSCVFVGLNGKVQFRPQNCFP